MRGFQFKGNFLIWGDVTLKFVREEILEDMIKMEKIKNYAYKKVVKKLKIPACYVEIYEF